MFLEELSCGVLLSVYSIESEFWPFIGNIGGTFSCVIRTIYSFVQKRCVENTEIEKKRKEKIATYFPISLRSSTWNVTIYNLGIRNTLYSHFEQYNMTLKDRRTLTVVAIDKHDIFTFALTIFKLHTDVDVLPRLRILNSYYLSKGHLT